MRKGNAMKAPALDSIDVAGRRIDYRIIRSKTAKKLRLRVGLSGVEVVQPVKRASNEVDEFLHENGDWIIGQLDRIERFRAVRKPHRSEGGAILFRGELTPVRVEDIARRAGENQVIAESGCLLIVRGEASRTPPAKTLENWLRRQARAAIETHLDSVTRKLKRHPRCVYIMGQRTKWGNCSLMQNLSFNWRIIMAPDYVLRYLVTHEAVHLAVPDHSHRFWLTVQSLCPDTERAKQWLCANSHRLLVDLEFICEQK
jgi:predicted metal-dependent hydrolase